MLPSSINISARIVFALCAFCLMAVILILIRKNAIKEKYVLLWLPLGIGFFVASLFPGVLLQFSSRIQLHYITVVLLGVIVVYTGILLYFSTRLSQMREDVKTLGQEIALLRANEISSPKKAAVQEASWVLGSKNNLLDQDSANRALGFNQQSQ